MAWPNMAQLGVGGSSALTVCELRDISLFHHRLLIDLVVSL